MSEPVIHSQTFPEGYSVTTTGTELRIEVTSTIPRPLRLNRQQLAHFGLRFEDDHYIDVRPGQEAEGVVDKMLASLDRAIGIMRAKEHQWDVENLKRIYTILGGLDEKVVQEILDEEKV